MSHSTTACGIGESPDNQRRMVLSSRTRISRANALADRPDAVMAVRRSSALVIVVRVVLRAAIHSLHLFRAKWAVVGRPFVGLGALHVGMLNLTAEQGFDMIGDLVAAESARPGTGTFQDVGLLAQPRNVVMLKPVSFVDSPYPSWCFGDTQDSGKFAGDAHREVIAYLSNAAPAFGAVYLASRQFFKFLAGSAKPPIAKSFRGHGVVSY